MSKQLHYSEQAHQGTAVVVEEGGRKMSVGIHSNILQNLESHIFSLWFKCSSPEMFLCSLHRVCHILCFFLGTGYCIRVISFLQLQCYPLLQLDPGMMSRKKDIL